ncbi:MAG: ATP-binding protein [Ignavibacteria bacterium]|nr:ATP-binding protein [Ignavibacteria bacterium]
MLKVRIYSFSYLHGGVPADDSGNGGGFVFDCRFVTNPGKFDEYKNKTGKDFEVKFFLETETEMNEFLNNVYFITDNAVKKYVERDFTDLMIAFGCTGGQHRSVYAAEQFVKHMSGKFPNVVCEINHLKLN